MTLVESLAAYPCKTGSQISTFTVRDAEFDDIVRLSPCRSMGWLSKSSLARSSGSFSAAAYDSAESNAIITELNEHAAVKATDTLRDDESDAKVWGYLSTHAGGIWRKSEESCADYNSSTGLSGTNAPLPCSTLPRKPTAGDALLRTPPEEAKRIPAARRGQCLGTAIRSGSAGHVQRHFRRTAHRLSSTTRESGGVCRRGGSSRKPSSIAGSELPEILVR